MTDNKGHVVFTVTWDKAVPAGLPLDLGVVLFEAIAKVGKKTKQRFFMRGIGAGFDVLVVDDDDEGGEP